MPLQDYYEERVWCDHEVESRLHKEYLEQILWKTFGQHPCDQGQLYEVAMFPLFMFFVGSLVFFGPPLFVVVRNNRSDFVWRSASSLGHFLVDLAVKAVIVLIWLFTRLPEIVLERWFVNWREWMTRLPEAPTPEPEPEPTPAPPPGPEPEPGQTSMPTPTPTPTPVPGPTPGPGPTPAPPLTPGPSQPRNATPPASAGDDDDSDSDSKPDLEFPPNWLLKCQPFGKISYSKPMPFAFRPAVIRTRRTRPSNLFTRPQPTPPQSHEERAQAVREQTAREAREPRPPISHAQRKTFAEMDTQIGAMTQELRQNRTRIGSLERQLAAAQAAPSRQPLPKDVLSDDKEATERSKREQAEQKARAIEESLRKQILEKDAALKKVSGENAVLKTTSDEKDAAMKKVSDENAVLLEKVLGEKNAQILTLNSRLDASQAELLSLRQTASINEQAAKEENQSLESRLNAAISAMEATEADAAEKMSSAEAKKKGQEASYEALRNELLDGKKTRERLEQEAEALRKENESVKKRAEDSEKSKEAIALENKENCARATKLEADIEATKATAEALHGEKMAPVEQEKAELLQRLEQTENALRDSQQICESLKAEDQHAQDERDAARSQILQLQAQSGPESVQMRQELGNLQARFNHGSAQYNRLTEEYRRLQAHLAEMEKSLKAEQRQKETLSGRLESLTRSNQDLNSQCTMLRDISQKAVREATAEVSKTKNEEIRQLRAQLQGANANAAPQTPLRTPAHNVINRSTPTTSKSVDSLLFSSGPRKLPLSPVMQQHAKAALANQQNAQMASMSVQLQNYARDTEIMEKQRDAAQEKVDEQAEELAALRGELDATKTSAQASLKDLEETLLFYEAAFENDEEDEAEKKQEQERSLQNLRDQLNATKTVLADQQSRVQHGLQGTKRIPSQNLTRGDDQFKKSKTVAEALLQRDLPRGYDRMPTSGEGLLCGLRAAAKSISVQHPNIPQITEENLLAIVHNPEVTARFRFVGDFNTNNFRDDQLDAIVHWHYESHHSLNVNVGVVAQGREPWLPGGDSDGAGDRLLVWIHNDREREIAEEQGGRPRPDIYNHWEGLEPRRPGRQQPHLRLPATTAPSAPRNGVDRVDNTLALPAPAPAPEATPAQPPSPTRRIAKCRSPRKNGRPLPMVANPFAAMTQQQQNDESEEESEEE